MISKGKHNVIGVNICAVDYEEAVRRIVDAAKRRVPFGVSALAVHGVMTGVMDSAHRYRLNQLEMIVPDGQPVRWALNLLHRCGLKDRVYGPDLMLETCRVAADEGLGVFLFGGKQELLDELESRLVTRFPQLKISGKLASKFRTVSLQEKQEIVNTINSSGASITMVGLGCPRQEVWAYEFREDIAMPVLAVGAAFNFHAGELAQAPGYLQRWGLEWLYRLSREPKRLWRRYIILNPYYVSLVGLQWLRLRKFNPDGAERPTKQILYG